MMISHEYNWKYFDIKTTYIAGYYIFSEILTERQTLNCRSGVVKLCGVRSATAMSVLDAFVALWSCKGFRHVARVWFEVFE
jgi:hypothetical protein